MVGLPLEHSLMVGQQILILSVLVRLQVLQPIKTYEAMTTPLIGSLPLPRIILQEKRASGIGGDLCACSSSL